MTDLDDRRLELRLPLLISWERAVPVDLCLVEHAQGPSSCDLLLLRAICVTADALDYCFVVGFANRTGEPREACLGILLHLLLLLLLLSSSSSSSSFFVLLLRLGRQYRRRLR
jgi:hypothetical protein